MSPRATAARQGVDGVGRADAADAPGAPTESAPSASGEPWPRGVSREPSMRISDVLADLGADFPAVTPSKLRFLEEQGLVEPRRTPGGYRQYSPADVERLRYVLRQQRDRYLPLKVIGEQLAELDAGAGEEPLTPRLATLDGERTGAAVAAPTVHQVAEAAGVGAELVSELVDAGVLRTLPGGRLDPWAEEVVQVAAALGEHGVDPRHLRAFRAAADRQVAIVEQIVAPVRGQRSATAQGRAAAVAGEVGELCNRMHTALVRSGVAGLVP